MSLQPNGLPSHFMPLMKTIWHKTTESPTETWQLAAEFFGTLKRGDVVACHGDLGAGKTCFIQGIAHAMDIREPVSSPTYTLINEYRAALPLYHMDLYRLAGPEEAFDLGLDEYIDGDGITIIEWAERAGELLPERTLHLIFEHGAHEYQRTIKLCTETPSC